ncbi:heavy metal translocating P-type ATPase [Bdellovibrio bacteriovorus]|uniref:heavy metal translocating P-type ATPase n=1 Tax=Bdellovibrio bacteriovorus TaxID=959 RepID=UPI0009BD1F61|nr:heavy metal translocating P-type ATPase [Bdellovibrio bacteriovorus]
MSLTTLIQCKYCATPTEVGPYCCRACEVLDTQVGAFPLVKNSSNPYSYLDQKDFKDIYRHGDQNEFDYLFYAEGLHCSSCVHLLEKLPEFYPDVVNARVNFAQSTVAIKIKDQGSLAQVAYVIKELGYTPSLLSAQDHVAEKFKAENRAFLKRIAVAGFCAGNTMLFVIPVYAGLAGTWAQVFNWLSFLLFLPILFYSAIPFYRGAWNTLKYKVINVDLPIVIAMLSGFILSTYSLIRGEGHIYYDSTASFLFFILSARYLLKRVQQNHLSSSHLKTFFKNERYICVQDEQERSLPWDHIQKDQILLIQKGQNIPADCELLSVQATVDMSLLNGESLPKVFSQHMTLLAGTRPLEHEIRVKVLDSFANSKLGKLFAKLEHGSSVKSPFVALTDRLAQKLIISVFGIAILFFALYYAVDPTEAFNRALALIVLACPCALAFGSPLAFGLALKKGQRQGLLIKDAKSLEKILTVKNIFFDKTGTLTEGQLRLSYTEPSVVDPELKKIILSLEAASYHPVAFALREAWSETKILCTAVQAEEILGRGVRGYVDGDFYEVRHLAESMHELEIGIEVIKNGRSISRLYFSDTLRDDAKESITQLKLEGKECFLVSGDRKSRTLKVAEVCGIAKENAYGELFPEDKKQILDKYSDTCMIGDGANDSLCLKEADVGIAVKGSVDLSLHSADIYLTRGGLTPVLDLFNLAHQTRGVLVRNLSISIVYNVAGGVLALCGFINPMMAAILMPVSSAALILSSLWGFR